jgi:hypothetical protein
MRETQFRRELEAVTSKPRPTFRFFKETEDYEDRRWLWMEETVSRYENCLRIN